MKKSTNQIFVENVRKLVVRNVREGFLYSGFFKKENFFSLIDELSEPYQCTFTYAGATCIYNDYLFRIRERLKLF